MKIFSRMPRKFSKPALNSQRGTWQGNDFSYGIGQTRQQDCCRLHEKWFFN
jgi:hypothetical protein